MDAHRDVAPRRPTLASLVPAVNWLLEHGVSVRRIAEAFRTTERSVLVTRSRENTRVPKRRADTARVALDVGATSTAAVVDARYEAFHLAREAARRTWDLDRGLGDLADLRRRLGRPTSEALLELVARCDSERGWCSVHLGATRSAVRFARDARAVWDALENYAQVAETLLVESHAWLYVNRPDTAARLLREHRDASEAAGTALGTEYHRQLATVHMLQTFAGNGELPKDVPESVTRINAILRAEGAPSDVALRFATRQRHTWRASPDLGACDELAADVAVWRGEDSLESVIAENYAAEAALGVYARGGRVDATLGRLEALAPRLARFPHQAAVALLLGATPRLRLEPRWRRVWVRHVRYFNPFRRL